MAASLTEPPTPSLGKCSATQCQIIQSKVQSYPSSQDRALTQSAHSLVKQQARRAFMYVRPCVLASGFHDEARQPALFNFSASGFSSKPRGHFAWIAEHLFLSSHQSVKVLSAHAMRRPFSKSFTGSRSQMAQVQLQNHPDHGQQLNH